MDFFWLREKQKNRKQKNQRSCFWNVVFPFPFFFLVVCVGVPVGLSPWHVKKKERKSGVRRQGVLIFVRCFSFVVSLVCRVCGF